MSHNPVSALLRQFAALSNTVRARKLQSMSLPGILLRNTRKSWPPKRGWTGGFLHFLAPRPAVLALLSLRNTRKSWPPNRGGTGGFLPFLAPRPAALALLRNTRKSWAPNRGWTGGFL